MYRMVIYKKPTTDLLNRLGKRDEYMNAYTETRTGLQVFFLWTSLLNNVWNLNLPTRDVVSNVFFPF